MHRLALLIAPLLVLAACGNRQEEPASTAMAPAPAETAPVTGTTATSSEKFVHVMDAWVRPPAGDTGVAAGYLTLHAIGGDNALIAASSEIAERVELHTHEMADGMMRMIQVERVALADNEMVRFAPGGLHLMLFGVTEALETGSMVPLTLEFSDSEPVYLDVMVRMPTAEDLEAASKKHDAMTGHNGH